MTLKLAASNPDPEPSAAGQGPRILAPGAPPSPGPVPNELAQHLSFGEALVWWNAKDRIDVGPVGLVLLAVLVILGFVTLFAPEFWSQPWSELAKPIAALLSPAALVLLRERLDQCSVLVTDAAIVGVDRGGHAVRLGLQSALLKLGYVPQIIQTDNSSAATRRLRSDEEGRERPYTDAYLALLAHYGLTPQTIHLGASDENGDVESSNGKLKQSVAQQLLLRGNRDFASLAAYESFLFAIMDKRNKGRQARLAEELAVMKPLSATPLANHSKQRVRVNQGSLIHVLEKTYSVPTSLIGKMVTVVIHEWSLEVYYAGQLVDRFARLIGNEVHQVNYRHVIDSLLRKPGGFRRYRYRDDLFPSLVFRQAWEALDRQYAPRRADLTYLRILHLAARHLECDVATALQLLLDSGQTWSEADVAELLRVETAVDVPLILVGGKGWIYEDVFETIEAAGVRPYVRHLSGIFDEELAHLYHAAGVLVTPSFYEGFGLPALEAMHCGCPAVVSRRGSLPEIVGPDGLMVDDPEDVEAWAALLARVLTDSALRARAVAAGHSQAQTFSWAAAAAIRGTAQATARAGPAGPTNEGGAGGDPCAAGGAGGG